MIETTLKQLGDSFEPFLKASNPAVVASLKKLGHTEADIRRIELFDWFQGVGLYGYYELYRLTEEERYLKILLDYYEERRADGLPAKNINAMAPMLTLVHLLADGLVPGKLTEDYWNLTETWARWLYGEAPRTSGGGLAHLTCEAANGEELWDDTLFMSLLFLAKAGMVLHRDAYVEEAVFQFMTHHQYLADRKTGCWFHGWTFEGNHNFVNALWARGNCWVTIFIPMFLDICKDYPLGAAVKRCLVESWQHQVEALLIYQKSDGLWPTLLDDGESYSEASATAGFLWGIQKGIGLGLMAKNKALEAAVAKGEQAILMNINEAGILEQVSGGTAMGKDSQDFYRVIPRVPKPYGQAMAMMALIEGRNTGGVK